MARIVTADWTLSGFVKAWSYSAWAVYDQCPLKYKLQKIDKLPEPDVPAFARGREIHDGIAKYLKAAGNAPFPSISFHGDLVEELLAFDNKAVEQQWAFTNHWSRTGWFDKSCWARVVLDVACYYADDTGELVDWKTGRRYGSNDDQMELFAIAMFRNSVALTDVTTRLAYVDNGDQEIKDYNRAQLPDLETKWEGKIRPLFEDTEFLPRPNDKCRLCHHRNSNGGPCRYG